MVSGFVFCWGFLFCFHNTVAYLLMDIIEKHSSSGASFSLTILRNLKVTFYEVISRKISIRQNLGEIKKDKQTIRSETNLTGKET